MGSARQVDQSEVEVWRALDRIDDAFLVFDRSWRILYANRSAERAMGRSRDELLGRVIWEAFPAAATTDAHRLLLGASARDEPSELELLVSRRWIACRVFPDAERISIFFRDVTEARRVADELRESEAKHRAMFEHSLDGMFWTAPTGEIFSANEAACRMFGQTEAELRAAGRGGVMDASDPRLAAALDERRRVGHVRAELTGVRKDGSKFPIEVATAIYLDAGGRERTSMTVRDLSERKRAEERVQTIVDAGAVLGSRLDSRETIVQLTRLLVPRMADCCAVDLLEDGTLHRVAASQREGDYGCDIPVQKADVGRLSAPRLDAAQTTIVVPLTARDKLVGVMSLALRGDARRYDASDLATARAVADRAALAIENARLHEQTTEAKRLRDEVLGVVSHDLRNRLNTIMLAARVLAKESDSPPAAAIVRAVRYADGLIRDLVTVTAIEGGALPLDKTTESVASIVEEIIALHRDQAASRSLVLEARVDADLPEVSVDRRRVLQLLDNLLGNAFKFTPAGGRIRVEARRGERSVVVRVSDTGSGIAADALPHVFDRFWQGGRERQSGVGLGLAIVKGIVEAHGGAIECASEEGRGTTFTFTLPVP